MVRGRVGAGVRVRVIVLTANGRISRLAAGPISLAAARSASFRARATWLGVRVRVRVGVEVRVRGGVRQRLGTGKGKGLGLGLGLGLGFERARHHGVLVACVGPVALGDPTLGLGLG